MAGLRQLARRLARPTRHAAGPARVRPGEALLERLEHERHASIAALHTHPLRTLPRMPAGYRADSDEDGFMPWKRAARVMGLSEQELLELVARGFLDSREPGLVRPAIVTVLGFADRTTETA